MVTVDDIRLKLLRDLAGYKSICPNSPGLEQATYIAELLAFIAGDGCNKARALRLMHEMDMIYNTGISWDEKYDAIFSRMADLMTALCDLGLTLTWCDPDASYEDDVHAVMRAVRQMHETVDKLP